MKAQLVKLSALAAVFSVLSACTETTGTDTGTLPDLKHDPILFVHGYLGSTSNWDTMIGRFKADGWADYELYTYQFGVFDSNVRNAQELQDKVDEIMRVTGATKVDIITHSMGGVSSRYYLKNLGGTSKVDAWVSLGGPNHGTDDVDLQNCQTTPCREIAIGSSFLAALNSGDETPGLVRYGTWQSPCDTTINPDISVSLSGATNTVTACIVHFNFLVDPIVYAQVKAFVE